MAELAGDGTVIGLAGRLQDGAVDVEQPPVVAAADAALRHDPVLQRRPAVAAVLVQQAEPSREVPEQNQLLVEHPDEHGPLPDLLGHRHRQPEPPEVLPARGTGPGVGQFRVLPGVGDAVVSVVAQRTLLGRRGHVSGPWLRCGLAFSGRAALVGPGAPRFSRRCRYTGGPPSRPCVRSRRGPFSHRTIEAVPTTVPAHRR